MRPFFLFLVCALVALATIAYAQEPCVEGTRRECGSDTGVCKTGIAVCRDGKWVECVGCRGQISDVDICGNGVDDNCNGEVDENCFLWLSLILMGTGFLFIGVGLYYMHREKGERFMPESLGKD